jgi:helicase required for RNAi-mediated heterochromatin assembly 1
MLKSMPNGPTSRHPLPTTTHHVLVDSPFQTLGNPAATPRPSKNATKNWEDYANGGAATDDAQYLQKSREEEAKYLEAIRKTTPAAGSSSKPARLIELSPKDISVSRNTNLLIDLDIGPAPAMGQIQQSYAGATSYKGKGKGKAMAFPNFLD